MKRIGWVLLAAALSGCSGAGAEDGAPLFVKPMGSKPVPSAVDPASPIPLVELIPADKRVVVPGFSGATAWLNVDHPLTKEELRGRVTVVDFWTSCCINCLHTLPTLHKLEALFRGQPVAVVGVHSPKFDEEREPDRLRDILRASDIEHPVAVDGQMAIWHAWGVEGWPTVAVLDVEGRAVWAGSGEPDGEDLTRIVASALDEGRRAGKLAKGELRGVRAEPENAGPLRYPGKVLALHDGGLAIADTGHHRVVITDKSGAVASVVGSGLGGAIDGSLAAASFDKPEGLAEAGGDLYVADVGNHLIRKIDRRAGAVSTVAGTGELGGGRLGETERKARSFALRSPWDLLEVQGNLLVALAGSHQIALFDPKQGTIRALAGNGREARVDGSLADASFAQPSALATDGKEVFVLDSETSSVRAIDIAKGQVRTVIGDDLFVFGDVDGERSKARLQHPIGMTFAGGSIYVADSYNSKVKRIDPKSGEVHTVLGGGGFLGEPAGLGAAGGSLFVADTNHHRVLRFPIASGKAEPVALAGLSAPVAGVVLAEAPRGLTVDARDPVVSLGALSIAPGAPSTIHVRFEVPSGTGINEAAPFRVSWTDEKGLAKVPEEIRRKGGDLHGGFDLTVQPLEGANKAELVGVLDMVVCDVDTHAVCLPVRRTLLASFTVQPGAAPAAATLALPSASR